MGITITLSEKADAIIRKHATERDQDVDELASDLLEETVSEKFPEYSDPDEQAPHPILRYAGMFSSGKPDTSTRHSEILREGVTMPGGFGGDD
jgi:hypothetical protein